MEEAASGSVVSPSPAPAPVPPHPQPPSSSAPSLIQRLRFSVELRPGETTIVSWKKLLKDSNKAIPSTHIPAEPSSGAHQPVDSRFMPIPPAGLAVENKLIDAVPPPNRFGAVIEKIERLYMGNQSSDDEELADVPDDDEYDTEDSFIDDAELDEYFQVDTSTTKHNGFFVNRGNLERLNEPGMQPGQAQTRRIRKALTKARNEMGGEHIPNKHVKTGNGRVKAVPRNAPIVGDKLSGASRVSNHLNEPYQAQKAQQNQSVTSIGPSKMKSVDATIRSEYPSVMFPSSGAPVFPVEAKDIEKLKDGDSQAKDFANKSKVTCESSDVMHLSCPGKGIPFQAEPRKLLNDTSQMDPSVTVQSKDKNGSVALPSMTSGCKYPAQMVRSQSLPGMEGSAVRPKGTTLERAIRELEKIVAESRPPNIDIQETNASTQGVKRRLPRVVKQKLAKVARLAQSSQGKISEELINRLMGILGHIVQLKTLKRNLKEMVELGLSAKQEKYDRFQQIKNEVIEMIRVRVPSLKSEASEQQGIPSNDFQKVLGSEEKGTLQGRYNMDDAMEDKICDLYDLYVEGMDEEKDPQIRKLYVELAELWPNGSMDNHGIKGAIYRAKARKKALHSRQKEEEKIKRRKLSPAVRTEGIMKGEASVDAQPQASQERPATGSAFRVSAPHDRLISNPTMSSQYLSTSDRTYVLSLGATSLDRQKQEKVKTSTKKVPVEVGKTTDVALLKKKVKKKPELDFGGIHVTPGKLPSQLHHEKEDKSYKHLHSPHNRSSLGSVGLPSFEQPSY